MLAAALTACDASRPRPEGLARRVVLITCDTLRPDHLGAYGYNRPTSPALDAFATESVVFEDCSSTSSITGPALSAILTGLYPDELGAFMNGTQMPAQAVTIAELAHDAGYPTAAVVSNPVLKRYPELGDIHVAQGFEHWDDEMTTSEANRPHLRERIAPDTAADAIRWLEAQRASGDDRFFLWVHFQDPHGPYTAPDEYNAMFAQEYESDTAIPIGQGQGARWGQGQIPSYQRLGPEEAPIQHPGVYRDRYDAEIRFFDDGFGTLVGWLREAGWLDDSLVLFTADHAEALGENDYWFSHGESVYRSVIHVPLIVRYPAGATQPAPTGARVATCVNHLDLWPTMLEALGLEGARRTAGTRCSRRRSRRTARSCAWRARRNDPQRRRWEGVQNCNHRLLFPPGENRRPQMYDIVKDPREEDNLIGRGGVPTAGLLQSYREERGTLVGPMPFVTVDFRSKEIQQKIGVEEAQESLRDLQGTGYAGLGDEDEDEASRDAGNGE